MSCLEQCTLSHGLGSIQDGAHESPQVQFGTPGKKRFLYITSKNIRNNYLDLRDVSYVDEEFHNRIYPRCTPSVGDVLLTKDGASTGNVTLNTLSEPFSLLSSVCLIKTDPAVLLPAFLCYYIQSPHGLQSITGQMTGAAIKRIILRDIKSAEIPLAPISEQQRIVSILDQAFESLAKAKENVQKNLNNANEVFASSFAALIREAEEDGCSKATVATIAEQRKGSIRTGPFGSQLLHSEFVEQGIAVLGIDNVVSNKFRWAERRFITPAKYQNLQRYRAYPGDVLITIMGTCGRCAIVPANVPVAINTKHLCCITRDKAKCLPEYFHAFFLHHPSTREFLSFRSKGAIMDGLNMGIIQELPILLPPTRLQQDIVRKLDSFKQETERLKSIYDEKPTLLDQLKTSFLQEAFSGQL